MCLICKCYDETETLCNCLQTDYHFEYTECDSSGSRWRVAVPNPSVECSGLPDPVKGKECSMSLLILQTISVCLCYLPYVALTPTKPLEGLWDAGDMVLPSSVANIPNVPELSFPSGSLVYPPPVLPLVLELWSRDCLHSTAVKLINTCCRYPCVVIHRQAKSTTTPLEELWLLALSCHNVLQLSRSFLALAKMVMYSGQITSAWCPCFHHLRYLTDNKLKA